jgi:hypothetical protein
MMSFARPIALVTGASSEDGAMGEKSFAMEMV